MFPIIFIKFFLGPRNDITIPRDNVIEGVRDASELQVGIARTVQQLVVS